MVCNADTLLAVHGHLYVRRDTPSPVAMTNCGQCRTQLLYLPKGRWLPHAVQHQCRGRAQRRFAKKLHFRVKDPSLTCQSTPSGRRSLQEAHRVSDPTSYQPLHRIFGPHRRGPPGILYQRMAKVHGGGQVYPPSVPVPQSSLGQERDGRGQKVDIRCLHAPSCSLEGRHVSAHVLQSYGCGAEVG